MANSAMNTVLNVTTEAAVMTFMTITTSNTSKAEDNTNTTMYQNITMPFHNTNNEAPYWIMSIYGVVTALIVFLGMFGNVLTMIIMRKEPFRSSSHGVLLTALALADMIPLILVTFTKPSTWYLLKKDVRAESTAVCKLFWFSLSTFQLCSSSIVTFICVERFINIWFPFQASHLLSTRSTTIISGCIFVAANVVAIFRSLKSVSTNGACWPFNFLAEQLPINDITFYILYVIVPTVILLLLTPLIILKLIRQQLLQRKMTSRSGRGNEKIQHLTAMLVGTLISYLVLVSLPPGVKIVLGLADEDYTVWNGWREIIWTTEHLNFSVNFFIYGLMGSDFRKHFMDIVRNPCICRDRSVK